MPSRPQNVARTAKQVGAAVRRARKAQGLTQAELGARIGLRQATISKLEAGEPGTQIRTLLDTLAALDLQLSIETRSTGSAADLDELF